jgi:AAT family amino acid transporter
MSEEHLRRGLKPHHLQFISIGGIIGSAYFLGTGGAVAQAGPAAVWAYLLGGLLVYLVMLCLGELAVHIPTSGSFVGYASEFVSPAFGCGVGWSYWLNWVAFVPSEMIAAGRIMHDFVPSVGILPWAFLFGALLTALNLVDVGNFGEMEFWLCLVKIVAILAFILLAAGIYLGGWAGRGHLAAGMFPHGWSAVLTTMVIILVNFQGTEIIGLAAAESENPGESIPAAVTAVSYRIIALYVLPVLLLVLIMPWNEASMDRSVFSVALERYGLHKVAACLSFVVLTAAISCSNSGIYATSRALFALSKEGMAPRFLGSLNAQGAPQAAILLTVAGCWLVLGMTYLDQSGKFYERLLAIAGFTGTITWISICWAQFNFRWRLRAEGISEGRLRFRAPAFPYLSLFAIFALAGCLLAAARTPDFGQAIYLAAVLLVVPMLAYKIWGRPCGARRSMQQLFPEEEP